jgi:hypothetical protein
VLRTTMLSLTLSALSDARPSSCRRRRCSFRTLEDNRSDRSRAPLHMWTLDMCTQACQLVFVLVAALPVCIFMQPHPGECGCNCPLPHEPFTPGTTEYGGAVFSGRLIFCSFVPSFPRILPCTSSCPVGALLVG